jgi:hypothetical protein
VDGITLDTIRSLHDWLDINNHQSNTAGIRNRNQPIKNQMKKIIEWGVFVEHECGSTAEVILSDEISQAISKYLDSDEVEYTHIQETKGKITW